MTFLVVRVAILVAMLTAWIPDLRGNAHKQRIRIVVPHKITHVHHHHHHPKYVLHRHFGEEDDSGSSEEHQEALLGRPRYAFPASDRSYGAPPFFYKHFYRKRIKPPRRYFRYEDDFRRWPREEYPFDPDEFR